MTSPVLYAVADGVVEITLNRPEIMNALSPDLVDELQAAFDRAGAEPGAFAVVVRGAGQAFSAGADLQFLGRAVEDLSLLPRFVQRINDMLFAVEELPLPVISVIEGWAVAGGFELLLASDFVLAAEDARMGDAAATHGLLSGAGATHRLLRRIGHQAALEILFTGKTVDGREAERLGIVLRAVARDALEGELASLLAALRGKSAPALAFHKRAIQRSYGLPPRQAIDEEMLAQLQYYLTSPHPAEGIRAFLEKRAPSFDPPEVSA